jgi:uncharacterized coiled-coil DUF342 family protein
MTRNIIVDAETNLTLGQQLANRINEYELMSKNEFSAALCLGTINEAYAHGVIEENNEKLSEEIKTLKMQIKEKDDRIASYLADMEELKQERDGAAETANKLQLELLELNTKQEQSEKQLEWFRNKYGGYENADDLR